MLNQKFCTPVFSFGLNGLHEQIAVFAERFEFNSLNNIGELKYEKNKILILPEAIWTELVVRRLASQLPVVVVADEGDKHPSRWYNLGCCRVVQQPCPAALIASAVQEVLEELEGLVPDWKRLRYRRRFQKDWQPKVYHSYL